MKSLSRNLLIHYLVFMRKMGWLPIRPHRGGGEGKTISRFFVDQFIENNIQNIQGNILEIGRNVYKEALLKEKVTTYTCLDISDYQDVDIVADIQDMTQIEDSRFDSIICTQVLEHLPNPFIAVKELHRILIKGGNLFITVPFLNNLHMEPNDYWRFTEYSLAELLKDFTRYTIRSSGNTFFFLLSTLGVTSSEIDMSVENYESKSEFPITIAAIAEK